MIRNDKMKQFFSNAEVNCHSVDWTELINRKNTLYNEIFLIIKRISSFLYQNVRIFSRDLILLKLAKLKNISIRIDICITKVESNVI